MGAFGGHLALLDYCEDVDRLGGVVRADPGGA